MSDQEEWLRLATMDVPLHPDLEPYLEEVESLGQVLRSPLVYAVPFMSPALVNNAYEQKRLAIEKATRKGDFAQVVWLHERPWRLHAFTEIAALLSDEEYWRLLSAIWVDSESIWQNIVAWAEAWLSPRGDRALSVMSKKERAHLAGLPENPILVHRGAIEGLNERGMSWTTSEERATWFARRFARPGSKPVMLSGYVARDDVLAAFLDRGEDEIVALPSEILVIRKVYPQ